MDNSLLDMFSKMMSGGQGQDQNQTGNTNRANNYYPNDLFTDGNKASAQNFSSPNQNNQNIENQAYNQNDNFNFSNPFGNQNQLLNLLLSALGGKNLSGLSDIMANLNGSSKSETQTTKKTTSPKDDILL